MGQKKGNTLPVGLLNKLANGVFSKALSVYAQKETAAERDKPRITIPLRLRVVLDVDPVS